MLHVDAPTVRKIEKRKHTRVEVVINLSEPMDAKGFGWTTSLAIKRLREEGSSEGYDDEFHVKTQGDDLVFFFKKRKTS
jgi:hypothetical protein